MKAIAIVLTCSLGGLHSAWASEPRAFLKQYCTDCHGAEKKKGDRRLDQIVLPASNEEDVLALQDIVDQINLGDMPPRKALQPSADERIAVVTALTREVTEARGRLRSTGGRTVLRRLNRREYRNTVSDLLALDMSGFDPTAKFPSDQLAGQFDNVGDVLQNSGYLLAQHVAAADQLIEKAVGMNERPAEQQWVFNGDFQQQEELDVEHKRQYGFRYLCLYEVMDTENHEGGYAAIHGFEKGVPYDGRYEIKVKAQAMHRRHPYDPDIFKRVTEEPFRLGIVPGDWTAGRLFHPQPLEPELAEVFINDGEPEWYTMEVWLDAGKTPRFIFPNGMASCRHAFTRIVTRYQDMWPKKERGNTIMPEARRIVLQYGQMPHIRIHEVQVRGPLYETWPPPSQRAVLGDRSIAFDPERTRAVLQNFADRACRHPVKAEVVERLMGLVESRRHAGRTPEEALKDGLKAVLCLPEFLYLVEPGQVGEKLPAHALAARLSYFLWASLPDAELRKLADSDELLESDVLLSQTRRMLNSPKSDAFVEGFLDSWLNLRSLGDTPPDRAAYERYYIQDLQAAMKRETQLFMRHLLNENGSVVQFLDSDHTFVNQPLATLYGLGTVSTPADAHKFRRVNLSDRRRGGLLGHASVLTVTANGVETSPVTRGVWLLNNLLGTPPAPPPDNVPAIDPDVRGATAIREILGKHRRDAACNECHQKIDPLGFALENFDPIGIWRTHYQVARKQGPLIDSSGELPSGEAFRDIIGLKEILVARKGRFVRTLTEKLLGYSCGRRVEATDRSEVDQILTEFERRKLGMRDLVELIVMSRAFRCK
ncbi:DUF1592 domain-containing protein [Prosthecobacter sp.]|uniref:DUF1592 domain-containing protein n=1 Tax=Prosthecobacter sp. TaxID=1965333 RepID=UPI003782E78E